MFTIETLTEILAASTCVIDFLYSCEKFALREKNEEKSHEEKTKRQDPYLHKNVGIQGINNQFKAKFTHNVLTPHGIGD